jgi:hypothetical protein
VPSLSQRVLRVPPRLLPRSREFVGAVSEPGCEVADETHLLLQPLDLREMSGLGDQLEASARYAAGIESAVIHIHEAIAFTPGASLPCVTRMRPAFGLGTVTVV